ADNDDMTYSEVNIQSQGRPYEAEGRDVIYSVINQHPQNDPGGSVLVKLADASPQTKSRWPVLSKPCLTVLLTCICVLLLIITCTMGGLYAVMKKSHADEKERLISDGRESKKNLEKASANYKSLESRLNITLQGLNGNLSECHRTLTEQKETISLISKEKQDLQSNLSDIQQEKLRSKKLLKSIEMFKKDSNRPRSDSVVEGLQKGCLLGWVFFKEKCYYVSTDTKNWENSRVDCEEMGGHLLNLDNKDKLL
ncbi:B-cell differentiation antigen CD72-like, partial [Denticeps clupeoides]|uniref:B-cell differentiation antigen CD72-like n=1 Tax=Denticeps clupeoides TaxID=299321 RepID=UPI0010A53A8E